MAGGSLLAALKQYVGDALPGGSLSPELAPARKYGEGVAQRAGQLVRDPTEFARQALLDVVPNRAEAQAAQARVMGGSLDPRAYSGYLGKMQDLGGLLGSIRVYHGSPHKFDKFDLSKIGTGEGAQAYGHGAYVAESPAVAQDYATGLSQRLPDRLKIDGNAVPGDSIYSRALEDVALIGKDGALQKLDDSIRFNEKYAPDMAELYKSAKAQIAAIDPARVDLNRGHLYEANLRWPDAAREAADPMGPQHFLDWDKPLGEQPAAVRNVMEKYVAPRRAVESVPSGAEWGDLAAPRNYDPTGAELLQLLRGNLNRMDADTVLSGGIGPEVSAKLRELGIPGIRYLDAGSRGAGQGSFNYVVFDDKLIELLKRNGVPIGK